MKTVSNTYFKRNPGGRPLMSGIDLPDRVEDTHFVDCTFHPNCADVHFVRCLFSDSDGIEHIRPKMEDCRVQWTPHKWRTGPVGSSTYLFPDLQPTDEVVVEVPPAPPVEVPPPLCRVCHQPIDTEVGHYWHEPDCQNGLHHSPYGTYVCQCDGWVCSECCPLCLQGVEQPWR